MIVYVLSPGKSRGIDTERCFSAAGFNTTKKGLR